MPLLAHLHMRISKKPIDRYLERLRFATAKNYIPKAARILDVGAGDGAFLRYLDTEIQHSFGIDPILTETIETHTYQLVPGYFPRDFFIKEAFDVITLLAVVEHLPKEVIYATEDTCWNILKTGGRVIITAPHPCVDIILAVLKYLRIIQGLALEEHYGFHPKQLPDIFKRWKLIKKQRWELGLNYLFVFEKT